MGNRLRLVRVEENGHYWYGGAQEWCAQKYMRQYGCGVIGCANVIMHLEYLVNEKKKEISKAEYMDLVEKLRRRFLLVFPIIGMNGLVMSAGMNLYFRKNHLNYYAFWGCLPWNIWKNIKKMLAQGCPVVLAIGPNFPKLWGKHGLNLYEKDGMIYRVRMTTQAHYVTVTEMDDMWMTVSSWGKKYYINKKEYQEYVKKYSNCLFSNILDIRYTGTSNIKV